MKKVIAVFASIILFACVGFASVAANAAEIERTTNKAGHTIDSFYMMCRVIEVEHDTYVDTITVEDNSGNNWEFLNTEKGYWKKGDTMTCIFDYCETCETLELNGVVG